MAKCPNCGSELEIDAPACSRCTAVFGPNSAWRPAPESTAESEAILKLYPAAMDGPLQSNSLQSSVLNISIALAFLLSTLRPGLRFLDLLIGLPALETLPVGQEVVVKAIFDLWIPAFLIYYTLGTTRLSEKFKPTRDQTMALVAANAVLILCACVICLAATVRDGALGFTLWIAAIISGVPALLVDAFVLATILDGTPEKKVAASDNLKSAGQKTAILVIGIIPTAYAIAVLTIGDVSPFKIVQRSHSRMNELCRSAGEKVVRVLKGMDGFYSDNVGGGLWLGIPGVDHMPVYRGSYSAYSLGSSIDNGESFVKSGRITFIEMPVRNIKGQGRPAQQYVRYRKDHEPEYVDGLLSQVGVFRTKYSTEEDEKYGLTGYEVTIRLLSSGEVTATSRYAFNKKTRQVCGYVQGRSFHEDLFIYRAFGW